MDRYRILSQSENRQRENNEKSRLEMDLAFIAAEIASMMCKIKCPSIRFITGCDHGNIVMNRSIDGYCFNSSQIFLKTGLPLAHLVNITIHEVRHAKQWSQPLWAGRSDEDAERDAKLFVLEFWETRRAETDPEKILSQLCEIGAPLAMAAGAELEAQFYVEEPKATGHPDAARLGRQFTEWCSNRERAENARKNVTLTNLPMGSVTAAEVRDYYYRVTLPKIAATYIKPHLRVVQGIYP